MKNHKLKIENLPILTEELSNDELAALKGGFITISLFDGGIFSLDIPGIVTVDVLEDGGPITEVVVGDPDDPIVSVTV